MKDIPNIIRWLLDFANLGCEPGKLNLPSYSAAMKLKRRPRIEGLSKISYGGFSWSYFHGTTLIIPFKKVDYWLTLRDFRDFFSKSGIPNTEEKESIVIRVDKEIEAGEFLRLYLNDYSIGVKPKSSEEFKLTLTETDITLLDYTCEEIFENKEPHQAQYFLQDTLFFLADIHNTAIDFLYYTARENSLDISEIPLRKEMVLVDNVYRKYFENQGYGRVENNMPFSHDGTLPLVVYAALLDFWSTKTLRSCLKQCKCCGKFWIEEKIHTKPKVFCSEACKNVFHAQSREDNKKAVKNTKISTKKRQQKDDQKKIVNVYLKNGYSQTYAEQKADDWVYKKHKSYKQFLRKELSFRGEGLL